MELSKNNNNSKVLEEWDTEPNELRFEHNGLKCLVLRMEQLGHLCGYVGIKEYPVDFDEYSIDVHGGVTYESTVENSFGVMKDYFEDCKHVIGFDAAHYMDISPKMETMLNKHLYGGTYKNMAYMKEETIKLAEQLARTESEFVKTFKNWKGDLNSYLQVGDIVDDELRNHFINVLPPITHTSNLIQMGEPYNHINGEAIFSTLERVGVESNWVYRGNCFKGSTVDYTDK